MLYLCTSELGKVYKSYLRFFFQGIVLFEKQAVCPITTTVILWGPYVMCKYIVPTWIRKKRKKKRKTSKKLKVNQINKKCFLLAYSVAYFLQFYQSIFLKGHTSC